MNTCSQHPGTINSKWNSNRSSLEENKLRSKRISGSFLIFQTGQRKGAIWKEMRQGYDRCFFSCERHEKRIMPNSQSLYCLKQSTIRLLQVTHFCSCLTFHDAWVLPTSIFTTPRTPPSHFPSLRCLPTFFLTSFSSDPLCSMSDRGKQPGPHKSAAWLSSLHLQLPLVSRANSQVRAGVGVIWHDTLFFCGPSGLPARAFSWFWPRERRANIITDEQETAFIFFLLSHL